jgi:transcriptional regulator of met regulon
LRLFILLQMFTDFYTNRANDNLKIITDFCRLCTCYVWFFGGQHHFMVLHT